jgi:cell fate regulator YaaT (PSP1 superfamily)
MPRLDARRPASLTSDDFYDAPKESAQWGLDDDGPPEEIRLAADLPTDAPDDDADPLTHPLVEGPGATLGDDVASVVGVRFVPGGRVQWFDAGELDYAIGDRVIVDSDRGQRPGWIGVPPSRRATRDRGLRRVIRRANDHDLRGERDGEADRAKALRLAKDKAAALRLPLKVFRVEVLGQLGRGAKVNVYYTSDERLDLRDFIRDTSNALAARIELRQLGVRDEAKAVGGIGSCGLTLCCTTWLPDFVPVSIKMAKDQGLVLSPTKVSGQCGRLKCCLVYEQAGYAELRKGLPKLGKRVIATRGEGRVVEVDVLRQRIRVSYGHGDTEVLPASEVKPMFPPTNQQPARGPGRLPDLDEPGDEPTDPSEATDDPSALANANIQPSFVGGAPSPVDVEDQSPDLSEAVAEATDSIDEALRDVPDDEPIEP